MIKGKKTDQETPEMCAHSHSFCRLINFHKHTLKLDDFVLVTLTHTRSLSHTHNLQFFVPIGFIVWQHNSTRIATYTHEIWIMCNISE